MKKTVVIAMISMFCLVFAGEAFAGGIGRRQAVQEKRIYEGIRSGELTRREARELKHQQRRIERYKRHALRDGFLSRRERARIKFRQDKAGALIYRLKHNGIYR